MANNNLESKVVTATKWSAITEVAARLVSPISAMIMARILTPEAYGAMAAIAIIISFTELFTDAGFQKYLIQHEFVDEDDRFKSTNVAFWTNLCLSLFFWVIIILLRNPLARLVGSPELGNGIAVACAAIPLAAFSSIQRASYQRDFDFKTLFYVRVVNMIIPFLVTIPLALLTRNYWALIWGNLIASTITAVILTVKSKWKPGFYYSFFRLKQMLAFCLWLIVESVLCWCTSYLDVFIVGRALNEYYLGIYRVSINTVEQILAIITASVLPVLLPALSRLQDDLPTMRQFLLKMQKFTSIIIIPLGCGILMYRNLITNILLGSQWTEAAGFIGLWGFVSAVTIVFSRFCTFVFPAIGKPRVSVLSQVLYLIVFFPAVLIAVDYGFEALYVTRSLVRIESVIVNMIIIKVLIDLSPWKMMVNIIPETIASVLMCLVACFLLKISNSIAWGVASVIICGLFYFAVLYLLFPKDRQVLISVLGKLTAKFHKNEKSLSVDEGC